MATIPAVDEIEKHLHLAIGLDGNSLITTEEAGKRAVAIHEEMEITGFPLVLRPWTSVMDSGPVPYPSYHIDDPRYDLNRIGPGESGTFGVNGPGISCGDLVKLGRICLLRRLHLLNGWPRDLKNQFLDPQSHLDAVEELNWLGRWHGIANVRTKVCLNTGDTKDVDFAFDACCVPLFTEVKNRRRESTGVIDGWHPGRGYPSVLDDLLGKFARSVVPGALNVACISTHLEPDESIAVQARAFLAEHPELDAIVVWSDHCRSGFEFRSIYGTSEIRQQIGMLLRPPDREETHRWFLLKHLGRNSAEARVLLPSEIPDYVRRIFT